MIGGLILAAAAAVPTGPLVTFKDWTAGCDNGRSCMAVGQYSADNFDLASVVVERGPLAGDQPVIWFRNEDKIVDLAADGERLNVKLVADADDFILTVDPASTATVVAALKSARSLVPLRSDGEKALPLSISGAAAAMRWIDEQQKRVGTVTAMVATGDKPPSAVPAPPPLPTVRQVIFDGPPAKPISDDQIKAIQEEYADCSDEEELQDKVDYARLDARTTLAIVTAVCGSGAYNYYGIPLLLRDNGKREIADMEIEEEGDAAMNLSWDAKTHVLSSYFKGRGLGDCGAGTDWVWDGAKFRIVKQTMMGECLGAIAWIPLYRARPVPVR